MNNDNISIKNELIYFKEDILKDFKSAISKLNSKYDSEKDIFSSKIEHLESKLDTLFSKVINLSNSLPSNSAISEKVESLEKFRAKTENTLLLYESKFNYQSKLLKDESYKIDSFINENFYYNGIIGPTPNCKFNNFHKFIDYIISNISTLNIFKEKTLNLDYKGYKNKINNSIEMIKLNLENTFSSNNNYTKKSIEECEERIKSILDEYDEKLIGIRLESNKYMLDLNKNIEILLKESKEMKKEIEELNNIDKYFNNRLEAYHSECLERYNNIKKSIEDIENRLNKKKEMTVINRPIIRKGSKIQSFLKSYIEGKMDVEEVIHHKNNNNLSDLVEINKNENHYNIIDFNKKKELIFSTPPLTDYFNTEKNYGNKNDKNNNHYDYNLKNYEFKNIHKILNKINDKPFSEFNRGKHQSQNKKNISKNNNLIFSSLPNFHNEDLSNSKINFYKDILKNKNNNTNYIHKINKYTSKDNKNENKKEDEDNKIIDSKSDKILSKDIKNEKKFKIIFKNKFISTEKDNFRNSGYPTSKKINRSLEYDKNSLNRSHNQLVYNKLNLNQKYINKIIIQSLINGKNSYSKLSLIDNNKDENYHNSLTPILGIKKILLLNNKNEINENNKTINIDKNNNTNSDNKSININNDIIDNAPKKNDKDLLKIINYSDNNHSKNKLSKKQDEKYLKSENSNNIKDLNIDKKQPHKQNKEKYAFKIKLEKKAFSNKKDKNKMILYHSFNKNKTEIIAINQIKRSLKYIRNKNNKTNLKSLSDKVKNKIISSSSNSNIDNLSNKKK